MDLQFDVTKQTLVRTDGQEVVTDSINYLHTFFEFSDEWIGLIKYAQFKNYKLGIVEPPVAIENGHCVVPSTVIKDTDFYVSVYGKNNAGEILITTNEVDIELTGSGYASTVKTYVKTDNDNGTKYITTIHENAGSIEYKAEGDTEYKSLSGTGENITSTYVPTNYTNTDSTIDGHLTGIDNEFSNKEPKFPTPTTTNRQYLYYENGERFVGDIVIGGGSAAATIYLTNNTSSTVGTYKELSYSLPSTETVVTKTLSATTSPALIETYIFDSEFGDDIVDAGKWTIAFKGFVNSASNTTYLRAVVFTRATNGTETTLFTMNGADINNTTIGNIILENIESGFVVDPTVKLGCRIYAVTDKTSDVTVTYYKGNGNAAYVNTPLALRHTQLRDINGDPNYQHLTTAQIAAIPQIITLSDITLTAADWYTDETTGWQAHKVTNAAFTSATAQKLNIYAANKVAADAIKTAEYQFDTQITDSGTATLVIYYTNSIPIDITLHAELIKGVQA